MLVIRTPQSVLGRRIARVDPYATKARPRKRVELLTAVQPDVSRIANVVRPAQLA